MNWIAFGVVWMIGLFLGDVMQSYFTNTSQIVLFGGMWMLLSLYVKGVVEFWQYGT